MAVKLYGTPEEIAEFEAAHAARIEEDNRRIASGMYGDIPDELTEEDERLLDIAWRRLAEEEAAEEAQVEPLAA